MYERKMLGLEEASKAVAAIINYVKREKGYPLSIAVVDYRGDLIQFAKMDGASWNSVHMAQAKAYSAVKMRRDSSAIGEWMQQLKISYADWADPNLTTVGGALCIVDKEASPPYVVGAIGISGWPTPEGDEVAARVGLDAIG
jgi:uncharacterized protein GlcG (DUF336 family)